jgi:hypothetical protein
MVEKKKEPDVAIISQLDVKKPAYKVAGKPPVIETKIDRLYDMIREKGSVKVSDAAKSLGVPEGTIQEWGNILEDHRMIEFHYPLTGRASLSVIRARPHGHREHAKKEKKPGTPVRARFTKKVMLIYLEIVILGELLIYIFLVNRYLAIDFVPTLAFHLNGFASYLASLPGMLASGNAGALLSNPLYFALLILVIAAAILAIVLAAMSRKPGTRAVSREEKHRGRKGEKQKEKKEEGKKKEPVFSDIVEEYKKRLRDMEK